MSVRVDDSECLTADICMMAKDCPFVRDCREVEAEEPEK